MTEQPKENPQVKKILDEIATMKTSLETKLEELKKIEPQKVPDPQKPQTIGSSPEPTPSADPAAAAISHVDHILDCPDCRKSLKEKIQKGEVVQCEGCGSILPKSVLDEKEKGCPECGSKTARKIYKEK